MIKGLIIKIYTLYFYLKYIFSTKVIIDECRFIFTRICMSGVNRIEFCKCYISKSCFDVSGRDNIIKIGGEIFATNIQVVGNNNRVIVEPGSKIYNSKITVRGNGCTFLFGSESSIGSACCVCMGEKNKIEIGRECMIADNVNIWNSDSHPIIDKSNNKVINPGLPIIIGDHVWIGKNSTVLKGTVVNSGVIIGMASLVRGSLDGDAVYVGNPIRKRKENVTWSRNYITI